jgi:hypothetical protein
MGPRPPVTLLRPPVWGGEDVPGLAPALADYHAWRRQTLRAARLGDELGRKRARAGLGEARRAAAPFLEQPHLRRAWEAVEYTEDFLVHERVDAGAEQPHDPSLCYLCDPGATIGISLPLAIAYATASLFQVENGEEADAEFLADWNELRRERGVRAVGAEDLAASPEARDDLRAYLAWEIEGVCLEYPIAHVRRWQVAGRRSDGAGRAGFGRGPGAEPTDPSRSRTALDALVARVTADAERYWLGNTWRNGFSSTRL